MRKSKDRKNKDKHKKWMYKVNNNSKSKKIRNKNTHKLNIKVIHSMQILLKIFKSFSLLKAV